MYMFSYLIAMAYLALPVELGSPCPPPSAIFPCNCKKYDKNTGIKCLYNNETILKSPIEEMSSRNMIIDYYQISSNRLETLGDNYFQDVLVRGAVFYCDGMKNITEKAFDGQQKYLSAVGIGKSQLRRLPIDALKSLEYLEMFSMINSELNEIEANAFDGMKSASMLYELCLSHNYIIHIGDRAFTSLTALRTLDLSWNLISEISPATLHGPYNSIQVLDLSHNRLVSVPRDLGSLPAETTVDLRRNHIAVIAYDRLRVIKKKRLYVDLRENYQLRCTCSFLVLAGGEHNVKGQCAHPPNLVGKNLTALSDSDFQNC